MRKTLCVGCSRYFTSTTEFDAHRTGPYGMTPTGRRCLSEGEMLATGWSSEQRAITDETGRPARRVWFRASQRAKMLEFAKYKAAKGIGGSSEAEPCAGGDEQPPPVPDKQERHG